MPAGRPKKTVEQLKKLWPSWKDDIIAMFSEGASREEVQAEIDFRTNHEIACSDDLWDRWMREEEEFSGTIKTGLRLCKAWWIREGRVNLKGKIYENEKTGAISAINNFSYTGWYMQMKNRFKWADKQDHEVSSQGDNELRVKIIK